MNWFEGSIAEAVKQSKTQNAIFMVYVAGSDENSMKMISMLNNPKISNKLNTKDFVAIKIDSGSEPYHQFAQIYQVVPVPSIFFIGKNGLPITIVAMVLETVDELDEKINLALMQRNNPTATATNVENTVPKSDQTSDSTNVQEASTSSAVATPSSESPKPSNDVVCEDGVCYRQSDLDAKVVKAKQLIEKKRKEKEEEDARLQKERELKRRQTGNDLQDFKRRQEEIQLQELKDERKRDKLLEQETRKRVLDQIAQDRLERSQKFATSSINATESIPTEIKTATPMRPAIGDFVRIQFKKPNGDTEMHTFNNTDTFICIRNYVKDSILAGTGIKNFVLATTFPKKEFSDSDNNRTLVDLSLTPSAVILVLVSSKSNPLDIIPNSGGLFNMISTVVMGILNPIFAIFGTIRNYVFSTGSGNAATTETGQQKRENEETFSANDTAKKRKLRMDESDQTAQATTSKGGVFKRNTGSNIHRLSDNRDSDEDDKTWNGNSTQQM